jgi:DNA-binding SARP family transcriptional activator
LFLFAGDQRAAATALGALESYLVGQVPAEVGALLSALDHETLLEFPDVWQAAAIYRALRIHPDQWLGEAEHVWGALAPAHAVTTWCGVATNLANCYFNRGRYDDFRRVIAELQGRFEADPVVALTVAMCRTWISSADGTMVDLEAGLTQIEPLLHVPSIEAMVKYDVLARWERFVTGDLRADQRTLTQAIEIARRLDNPAVLVLALVEAAFAAWFAGDDALFEEFVDEAQRSADSSVEAGIVHFIDCARGSGMAARFGAEKFNARAYGQLVAAARAANLTEARRLCQAALATADESRQPAYRALARVALALLEPANFEMWAREALAILSACHLPALQAAIESLSAGRRDAGILQAFCARFRAIAERATTVAVGVLDGEVLVAGTAVEMSARSRELLFFLASEERAFAVAEISDALWPESDGDRAENALRVSVNRVRHLLGTSSIVSVPGGYRLGPGVAVDLKLLDEVVRENANRGVLSEGDRERLSGAFDAAAARREASRPRALARRIEAIRRGSGELLVRDALRRQDYRTALYVAEELVAELPFDEPAHMLLVECHLGMGERERAAATWAAFESDARTNGLRRRPLAYDQVLTAITEAVISP